MNEVSLYNRKKNDRLREITMQEPEDKKRVGKRAAPERTPNQDAIRADADLYGDEADVPIRRKKKKKSAAGSTKSGGKKKPQKRGRLRFFSRFSQAKTAYARKTRAFLEIVRTEGENPRFKSVLIYGHRVPFWPLVCLILVVALVAMVFLNNSNLRVAEETITVVGLSPDLEDYKLLVVSDLNGRRFGDRQSSLLRTIGNLDYDAIFFLGDMVGKSGDPEPFYELLEGIPASKKAYFICGDSDPGPYVAVPRDITGTLSELVLEDWILGAIERGAIYVNAPVCLSVGSSSLWITPSTLLNIEASENLSIWKEQTAQEEDGVISGLAADYQTLPITTYRYRIAQSFYDVVDSISEDDFLLALSHEVPSDKTISISGAHSADSGKYLGEPDLILAGHYCGGVWRLPVLGAFYIPDNMLPRNGWFPAQSSVRGLSAVNESQVYITGGLSINGATPFMAFRLCNQPEISLLTLTATLPESMLSAE